MLTNDESGINGEESSDIIFKSAAEIADKDRKQERLSTGSENLNLLLDGGLQCGAITQFYGESKVGKTHLCHQLCAVLPLHYKIMYIDTEDGFSTAKIKSVAEARGLNCDKILKNIIPVQVHTTKKLQKCIELAENEMKSKPSIKLLIVDSLTYLYRVEFTERSQLPERQAKMSKVIHTLLRIARMNEAAIVVTNQIHSNPRPYSEADKLKAVGGNILSHSCKYIINIENWGERYRRAILEKHPYRPHSSLWLLIDDKGFVDRDPYQHISD
jgi:RecA/RadA recombinase